MVRIGLLTLVLVLAVHSNVSEAQDSDPRAAFAQAYALYTTGNYSQARELLEKTTAPKYPLADYSLHYLAVISLNEKNWDLSRHYLSQLRRRYPQSIWFHNAELQRAKIDLAEKKYPQVIAAFRALRSTRGGRQEISQESLHLEAQAREASGEANQAFSLYQQLRVSYPHSRWTAAARKEQARLREKFPDLFGFHTPQSFAEEADRLTREQAYGEATTIYKKLLSDATDPEFRLRMLVKLAGLYLDQRRRDEAMPLLNQIARDYPETAEAPKATYQIGQILWNRHENAQALDYFKRVTERYRREGDRLYLRALTEDPLILEEPIYFEFEYLAGDDPLILPYRCELDQARFPTQYADPEKGTSLADFGGRDPELVPVGVEELERRRRENQN